VTHRFLGALTALAATALAAMSVQSLLGQAPAPKTKTLTLPRTADGHPDLTGIWTNATLTPLERPEALAKQPVLTDKEAAAYEKQRLTTGNMDRRDGDAEADVARAYNDLFYDRGSQLARVDGTKRTSFIVDPPDGKLPNLTASAQARLEEIRANARLHPADRPENRSLPERCLLWGTAGPPMVPGPYNNTYQIVQTPGYVMILIEMIHDVRIIPLDAGPHLPPNVRLWMGDSRGRWEGDTLVVDTTNFTSKTRFRGSDENLHLIERFRRVDADTILYKFTVEDPTAFTKPWTAELPFLATTGSIFEYACHEGNYALMDILKGARAEEKKAADAGKK
jgi:hypothetical protein